MAAITKENVVSFPLNAVFIDCIVLSVSKPSMSVSVFSHYMIYPGF